MEHLSQPIQTLLEAHCQQRLTPALLLELNPLGLQLTLKVLESLAASPRANPGVLFVTFYQPFTQPATYVEDVLDQLRLSFHMETLLLQQAAQAQCSPEATLESVAEALVEDLADPARRADTLKRLQTLEQTTDALLDPTKAPASPGPARAETPWLDQPSPDERALPDELKPAPASAHTPAQRLRAALKWLRAQRPSEGSAQVCVSLLPLTLENPALWQAFVDDLLGDGPPTDWSCLRLVLRFPEGQPLAANLKARRWLAFERWLPAIEPQHAHQERMWQDLGQPPPQRLSAGLTLATDCMGHQQASEALLWLERVATLAHETQHWDYMALARSLQGDLHQQAGRLPHACLSYQQALSAAQEAHNPLQLELLLQKLGTLSSTLQQWTRARDFLLQALELNTFTGQKDLQKLSLQALIPVWEALEQPEDARLTRKAIEQLATAPRPPAPRPSPTNAVQPEVRR